MFTWEKNIYYKDNQTHSAPVWEQGQESVMPRWIQDLIYHPPPPPHSPIPIPPPPPPLPSFLAPCLWSCRCHSPFSLLFPSPPPLSSRVKRHYIIMQEWIIVMVVVCESRESGLGSEGWQGSRWQTKGRAMTLNGCCAPYRWDMFRFGDKSWDYTCIAFNFSLCFLCSKTENWCWCLCLLCCCGLPHIA